MVRTLPSSADNPAERPRRRWFAPALAVSLVAHAGLAAMLRVEQPSQSEAGAIVAIEIVSEPGAARPSASNTSASGARNLAAPKPEAAPAAKAVLSPQPPRAAREPPHDVPPQREAPPPPAPERAHAALVETAEPRRPARIPPPPAKTPRLASPPVAAQRGGEQRAQTASVPVIAADAAPAAGPESAHATPPRYGFGSAANPVPRYPEAARANGWEGVVLLRVSVGAGGETLAVSIGRSSGHGLLDAAALDAVRRWRFEPARRAGVPVPGTALVPIRFRLDD